MKHPGIAIAAALCAMFFSINAHSQATGRGAPMLLDSASVAIELEPELGWSLEVRNQLTPVAKDIADMISARGAIHFGSFALGLALTASPDEALGNELLKGQTDIGYGGLLLDYAALDTGRVSLHFEAVVGGGGACVRASATRCEDEAVFFLAEPGARFVLGLTDWLSISLGFGARLALVHDWEGPSSKGLSGPTMNVGVIIGQW